MVLLLVVAVVGSVAVAYWPRSAPLAASCSHSPSPLVQAAADGNDRTLISLLGQGHNVDEIDEHGRGALYCAIAENKLSTTRLLLDREAQVNVTSIEARGTSVDSPLHRAARGRSSEFVTLLLSHAGDANRRVGDRTPLGVAIEVNAPEVARVLLDHGADPNLYDQSDLPLHAAASRGDVALVESILNHGADIHGLSQRGSCPDLRSLLSFGGSPEGCATAVAAAAQAGQLSVVRLLLDRGADPTSGMYAASVGNHLDITVLLLDRGANPDGPGGTTPLLYNTLFGNDAALDLLLDRGADPNKGGEADSTTLQFGANLATFTGMTKSEQATLTRFVCTLRGTAPNLPPVIAASAMGNTHATLSLLDHGADINASAGFEPSITAWLASHETSNDELTAELERRGAAPVAAGIVQPHNTTPGVHLTAAGPPKDPFRMSAD